MADTSSESKREPQRGDLPFSPFYLNVFGDREVFGLANRAGLELWFFNPDFAPNKQTLARRLNARQRMHHLPV